MDKAREDLSRANQEITKLSGDLGLATGQLEGVRSELAGTQEQLRQEQARAAETQRTLANLQRDFQEAKGRLAAAKTHMETEMKKGKGADKAALQALQVSQDKATSEVTQLQGKLQVMSRELGISQERTVQLAGKLKFTESQLFEQPKLLGLQSQVEIAKLMKDKEYLEKHIASLKAKVRAGDSQAQMDVDTQEERLRGVDSRLAKEFQRGQETGRVEGITLGRQQAATEFQQVSSGYESRIAKFEADLKLKQEGIAQPRDKRGPNSKKYDPNSSRKDNVRNVPRPQRSPRLPVSSNLPKPLPHAQKRLLQKNSKAFAVLR